MPYFDPTAEPDLALLPPALRTHADLARVAAEAESDLVVAYTEFDGLDLEVRLRGYAEDPGEADTGLAAALRAAIAKVTAHRLQTQAYKPGVASESRGARSVTYTSSVRDAYPVGYDRGLALYDERPPVWTL